MRWYTSTDGQTSGPHEESEMREFVDRGRVTVDSRVRDEQGGTWQPIAESPLAHYVVDQIGDRQAATASAFWGRTLTVLGLSVLCLATVYYWFVQTVVVPAADALKGNDSAERRNMNDR